MRQVPLSRGKFALVDDSDYPLVAPFRWTAQKAKHTYYAARYDKGDYTYMHRFLLGAKKGQEANHKDGNGLNNQKENLQLGSHQQNSRSFRSLKKKKSSQFRGVTFWKRDSNWKAGLNDSGKHINLGYFPTEELAARAYDAEARKRFREFACLNFPN